MIEICYSWLYKKKENNSRFFSIYYKFIKLLLNICYPLYCKITKNIKYNKNNDDSENIIISLTTFPARINSVSLTIETLLRQTYKVEKIILWLAESQFDGLDSLPKKLLSLQDRGLSIRFCEDLKSHKKYYFTMKENPKSIVITVDDDMLYPENLVEELMKKHKEYPDAVCCNWAHRLIFDNYGNIEMYKNWEKGINNSTDPKYSTIPVGCGGVLYPPGCLNELLYNKEDIVNLCLNGDDLWLKCMAALNGTKSVMTKRKPIIYFSILKSQKKSLYSQNLDNNNNDFQMNNIISKYPFILEMLSKKDDQY